MENAKDVQGLAMNQEGATVQYDPIPETVEDALVKWDAGEAVFSVEMGGLGPGYEMAIQGLAFEIMREIKDFRNWENEAALDNLQKTVIDPIVHRCNSEPWASGFSGAQVGAAANLACAVCRKGYRSALREDAVKDRRIQVCKKDLRGYVPALDKETAKA